jgi:hypothetical protein
MQFPGDYEVASLRNSSQRFENKNRPPKPKGGWDIQL